jgi:hypothetical protein
MRRDGPRENDGRAHLFAPGKHERTLAGTGFGSAQVNAKPE